MTQVSRRSLLSSATGFCAALAAGVGFKLPVAKAKGISSGKNQIQDMSDHDSWHVSMVKKYVSLTSFKKDTQWTRRDHPACGVTFHRHYVNDSLGLNRAYSRWLASEYIEFCGYLGYLGGCATDPMEQEYRRSWLWSMCHCTYMALNGIWENGTCDYESVESSSVDARLYDGCKCIYQAEVEFFGPGNELRAAEYVAFKNNKSLHAVLEDYQNLPRIKGLAPPVHWRPGSVARSYAEV